MYKIGIDLGGTNIAGGIIDNELRVVHEDSLPTLAHRPGEEVIHDIGRLCHKMLDDKGIAIEEVKHVGVGVPGITNPDEGAVIVASNLNISNMNLREILSKVIDLPIYLENDANCAALGEFAAGAAKGYKNSLTITLGTGVGGGIIIDGKIYSGPFFGAGELGHQIIVDGGEPCGCGRNGHWEAYSSATALIKAGQKAGLTLDEANPSKSIFDAANSGDEAAKAVVSRYIHYLCVGLTNIVHIFQPEAIVIGGGISKQGQSLLNAIDKEITPMIYGDKLTKILIAALGNTAGIIGAAMLGE